jgi:D-alanyl-D-alanine dipeptidase
MNKGFTANKAIRSFQEIPVSRSSAGAGRKIRKPSRPAILIFFLILFLFGVRTEAQQSALPKGFVYLEQIAPDIKQELRYFSDENFVGRPVDGYLAPKCILTRQAAEALKKVQEELKPFGLGLKVYDGYRPQRAVNHFIRWARDLEDMKTKNSYYPDVAKENLFKEGYIADRSSHSRGSTVDLTLISLSDQKEIDMGSSFDWFGPESWPTSVSASPSQRAHRLLLKLLMEKQGFNPYPQEWWHFTLRDEPFPETYFDFPVQ